MGRGKSGRGRVVLFALCLPVQPFQAQQAAVVPAGPLPRSETLQYNIEWRLITARKMRLKFAATGSGFQTNIHMESAGPVAKLFKADDRYSSRLDHKLCAHSPFFTPHEGR